MRSPLYSRFLITTVTGLLLLLAADTSLAQTFTLSLPNRSGLPVGRIKISLETSGAPTTGSDQLAVPGGTKNLTATPIPTTIGGNRVLFYRGTGNTEIIDIDLLSLLGATSCLTASPNPFPTTLSFTATLAGGNTITGYRLTSYSAMSSDECTCRPRRRLDDPGASWSTPPPGTDRGRHPLDVVLVLDRSDSMNDPVPAGLAGSLSEVKITVLKTAVSQFIEAWKMEPNAPLDDRLAVVWFETGVIRPPAMTRRDTAAGTAWDPIKAAVLAQPTGAATAMGDGLSEGIDLWEDDPVNDATIVLMTNGMQNRGNKILPANCNLSLCTFNHLNAPTGYRPVKEVCIPVLTIGIGPPSSVETNTLDGIAQQTAGVNFQAVNAVSIANAFGSSLVETLKGNTMSILTRTGGTLNAGSSSVSPATTFKLDGSVRRALVLMGWTGAGNQNALRLELTKPGGGPPIGAMVPPANDPFYTIQAIDIPTNGSTGDWQATVVRNSGTSNVPFYVSIYTFEATFGSRFDFREIKYGTGDDIILTAGLSFGNQPLLNQNNGLQVTVERPETALNAALHTLSVSNAVLTTQPSGVSTDSYNTPYERKLFNLLQTTNLGRDIEPKADPTIFTMFDNGAPANGDAVAGDGIYSMRYSKTRVPGRYRFKVNMNLTTPTGQVNRTEQRDTQVVVRKLDSVQSEINATNLFGGNWRIDIVPADTFGNFLGPGYVEQIQVSLLGGGTVSGPVVDERQNGTYTVQVAGVPVGANPTIKASFNGTEFGSKTLTDAQRPIRPYAFFFGLGGNFPQGNFNNFYDSGLSAQVGFEYMFTNRVSVEGTFGYDRFQTSFFTNNLNLYRGSGNVKFYPVIGTFQFGIFGGGGVYHFTAGGGGGDTRGGVNFGAVGEYRINTSVSVESTYNFHNVFTPGSSTRFSTLQGGVRFRF